MTPPITKVVAVQKDGTRSEYDVDQNVIRELQEQVEDSLEKLTAEEMTIVSVALGCLIGNKEITEEGRKLAYSALTKILGVVNVPSFLHTIQYKEQFK